MKHFNSHTNVNNNNNTNNNINDNNNNANDDTYDDTYYGKIRDKISYIRMTLSRLGNTITIKDKEKIKKEAA